MYMTAFCQMFFGFLGGVNGSPHVAQAVYEFSERNG